MLLILLKVSIAALIFAIGMTAITEDIVYLWRRPALLLKSIIAMYVVMPAVAVLMARTFDLPPRTELALVVLAICAGAPLLPKKLIKFGGDPSYVFSLIVTTSLLANVCASRHIGLALLIAASARKQQALALVVAYLLASAVVSIPYVRWITKHRPSA